MDERLDVTQSEPDTEMAEPDVTESNLVACESRPGRTVFTEPGNSDAWIATDLTVDTEL